MRQRLSARHLNQSRDNGGGVPGTSLDGPQSHLEWARSSETALCLDYSPNHALMPSASSSFPSSWSFPICFFQTPLASMRRSESEIFANRYPLAVAHRLARTFPRSWAANWMPSRGTCAICAPSRSGSIAAYASDLSFIPNSRPASTSKARPLVNPRFLANTRGRAPC